jgi:hypothetical protein
MAPDRRTCLVAQQPGLPISAASPPDRQGRRPKPAECSTAPWSRPGSRPGRCGTPSSHAHETPSRHCIRAHTHCMSRTSANARQCSTSGCLRSYQRWWSAGVIRRPPNDRLAGRPLEEPRTNSTQERMSDHRVDKDFWIFTCAGWRCDASATLTLRETASRSDKSRRARSMSVSLPAGRR